MHGQVHGAPAELPTSGGGVGRFYATRTGVLTARLLRERLRALWPALPGQSVLGLGYASPYLRLWRPGAPDGPRRCVALTPAHLPRWRWPRGAASATAVGEEDCLPFPDLMFDRVLLVHGLEHAENARRLLRETWRVLRDDGRLLVVVPNRTGLWAYLERTPFGHGHPYTPGQLAALLRGAMFAVERRSAALFVPPVGSRLLLRGILAWDRAAGRLCPHWLGGLTVIEARKEMAGLIPAGAARARPRRVLLSEAA